jgi:hypothetical protein
LNKKDAPLAVGVIPSMETDRIMLFYQFCF